MSPTDDSHAARSTVLDAAALARLQDLDPQGTTGLVPRILRTYLASLERLLPQAEAALAARDVAGLRYVAHTLKSSSSSVGALQMAATCLALERQLAPPSQQDFEPLSRAMLGEGRRVMAALLSQLDASA